MNIKTEIFFLLRSIGGHRFPKSLKKPVGDFLILDKSGEVPIIEQRRHLVASLMAETATLDGDIIECGVLEGFTTIVMAKKLKELNSKKTIYGVDAFDSFPFDDNDYPFEQKQFIKKKFSPVKGTNVPSMETVQKRLDDQKIDNVKLIKGLVADVFPTLSDKKFCFANVDVDSYLATKQCIEFLKDRITEGGIIFLDDYNVPAWPGATQAANEILGKSNITVLDKYQAYWRKGKSEKSNQNING